MTNRQLIAYRKKLKMTQREFAEHIDVSIRTLQNWEQGHRVLQGYAAKWIKSGLAANPPKRHQTNKKAVSSAGGGGGPTIAPTKG